MYNSVTGSPVAATVRVAVAGIGGRRLGKQAVRGPLQACHHLTAGCPCLVLSPMADHDLVITAIVVDHINTTTPKPLLVEVQHPNFTMVDMGMITWVVMGLGCLVLSLCVLLASILIYQHCRCEREEYFGVLKNSYI